MKEHYFTSEHLSEQTQSFLQQLSRITPIRKSKFHPKDSALLVLDMQAFFLHPSSHAYVPSAQAIIPKIISLIQAYVQQKLPLIFTQHLNSENDTSQMATWWSELITPQHPLALLDPQLPIANGELIIKSQYDAFYNTSLETILQKQAVTQVVICGVMTHLCCETTARSAFIRGYEVFSPIDGTATYNRHFHLASLTNLAHGFASIITMDDLLKEVLNHGT